MSYLVAHVLTSWACMILLWDGKDRKGWGYEVSRVSLLEGRVFVLMAAGIEKRVSDSLLIICSMRMHGLIIESYLRHTWSLPPTVRKITGLSPSETTRRSNIGYLSHSFFMYLGPLEVVRL